MDSLNISTGEKRISINGDPARVIIFNPNDIVFAEKFYRLIGDFETKLSQYQEKGRELDASKELDSDGLPVNMQERIDLVKEACTYIRDRIDSLFGPGTSQTVFGDSLNLESINQFFTGITPFIQAARAGKMAQYTNKRPSKKVVK